MGRARLALAACAGALFVPADAQATTIRMGPDVPTSLGAALECLSPCPGGKTRAELVSDGFIDGAPVSGLITSWRVVGFGALRLRVIREAAPLEWVGEGTSAPATNTKGQANAASLPIHAGELIGVDQPSGSASAIGYESVNPLDNELIEWSPALADGADPREQGFEWFKERILVNADIVLAPVLSSISPASGSTVGGNAVTIAGQYLDGATSVTFGSTPASSFSVDSAERITAIAPASAPSTVDVRVTGPGGASEVGAADRYEFVGPATAAVTTPPGPAVTAAVTPMAKPAVSGFSQSASKWRRGGALPRISRAGRSPIGTIFSFTLNEAAAAKFAFTKRVAGRRVGGRCVGVSRGNAGKPKCKRTVSAGSFAVPAHAGLDKVSFQGRLGGGKTLAPGAYAVAIAASDAQGLRAVSPSLAFTIVG